MLESNAAEGIRERSRRRERSPAPALAEEEASLRPRAKKARVDPGSSVSYVLYVRWFGPSAGQTKVTALPLRAVSGVEALPVGVLLACCCFALFCFACCSVLAGALIGRRSHALRVLHQNPKHAAAV